MNEACIFALLLGAGFAAAAISCRLLIGRWWL
jgi:hypothetical protein